MHCTSSGKLYLSRMTARQRRLFLNAGPLKRYTEKTITDPKSLEAELATIAKAEYATDDEGFLAGLISVAVPVRSRTGGVLGTVAVHAPGARLNLERAVSYVPLLVRAADTLAATYAEASGESQCSDRR
jgi:DNA-binding IclR family transcriptional regulator